MTANRSAGSSSSTQVRGQAYSSGTASSDARGAATYGTSQRLKQARINADKLHTNQAAQGSNSEDEATEHNVSTLVQGKLPMGIYRREYRIEPTAVSTTAQQKAEERADGTEEESLWVDGIGPDSEIPPSPREVGTWGAASKSAVKVKSELTEEDPEGVDLDVIDKIQDSDKKDEKDQSAKPKKPRPTKTEDQMLKEDLRLLATEFSSATLDAGRAETKTDEDRNLEERLYLFQFPPLLPPLHASGRWATSASSKDVKKETSDVEMRDAPSLQGRNSLPVDLTREILAKDPSSETPTATAEADTDGDVPFASKNLLQGGLVGKMHVHKSGKISMEWGGMNLELSTAVRLNHLTTAVIVEKNDEKQPEPGSTSGSTYDMGKIFGRFVLNPTWAEEDEWEVSQEDLEIPTV